VTPDGPGIFLRDLKDLSPETAARWLTWVAVPVLTKGRRTNRDLDWYARFQDLGGRVVCWSWFDAPDQAPERLREAFQFASGLGAVSFILNGEKGWRGRSAVKYVEQARALADRHGMSLGLVSYSIPRSIRDFPWADFAERVDFGMPEVYDRRGAYDPKYPRQAIEGYEAAGFETVVPACAIYVRGDGRWRWRTAQEIARHLALFPRPLRSVCAWTIGTRSTIPEACLSALAGGMG
jgi:hypothetical protein